MLGISAATCRSASEATESAPPGLGDGGGRAGGRGVHETHHGVAARPLPPRRPRARSRRVSCRDAAPLVTAPAGRFGVTTSTLFREKALQDRPSLRRAVVRRSAGRRGVSLRRADAARGRLGEVDEEATFRCARVEVQGRRARLRRGRVDRVDAAGATTTSERATASSASRWRPRPRAARPRRARLPLREGFFRGARTARRPRPRGRTTRPGRRGREPRRWPRRRVPRSPRRRRRRRRRE